MFRLFFILFYIYAFITTWSLGSVHAYDVDNTATEEYPEEKPKNDKEDLALSGSLEDEVRIIKVRAFRYGFEPDPIVVKLGEEVRLEIISNDVVHSLKIDDFEIYLVLPPGVPRVVEFIADKQGEFRIYCSVYCGPGYSDMHAKLIVKQ